MKNFQSIIGKGIPAQLEWKNIKVVNPNYLTENNISLPDKFVANSTETIVVVLLNEGQLVRLL